MKNFQKYCILILILTAISACADLTQPTVEDRFQVSGISKWKVDNATNEKINILYRKSFDRNGSVLNEEEYNESGKLISKSEFSYDKNTSTESKSIFDTESDSVQLYITKYEYDDNKRVIKQVLYDNQGNISDIIVFNYDSWGNVVQKYYEYSSTNTDIGVNFDYEYNKSGEILERLTNDEFGNITRDSMSYNRADKSFIIYKFDSNSNLIGYTAYFYNSLGNIMNEVLYNSENKVIAKYVYEYTYF